MKIAEKTKQVNSKVYLAFLLIASLNLTSCISGNAYKTAHLNTLSKERIAEIVASPDRSSTDKTNDLRRKPDLTLEFIGIRPGMVALDLSASGGYTTELLARAVGPTGRVYGQSAPRNLNNQPKTGVTPEGNANPSVSGNKNEANATPRQPRLSSPEALAQRTKNPLVNNIIPVVRVFESPVPDEVSVDALDLVTIMFNYHDLVHMGVDRSVMNQAIFSALKTGGIYVIADHSGRPNTGSSEAGTLHRIEESFLRKEVESTGFKFVAQGNFLRNPADPRDRNTPEPPQSKDEFFLKFVKP
jgi:predicted methyltransferase